LWQAKLMTQHAWEASLTSWEAELHDPDPGDDSESDVEFDWDAVTEAVAQEELGSLIIGMKHRGTLTATDACLLCWWAHKAGVKGVVAQVAMRPGHKNTGNYSRHFDKIVNPTDHDDDLYVMTAPGYHRSTDLRVLADFSVLPPHDAADEEIRGNPGIRKLLEECRNTDTLPPAYNTHEIVRNAPEGTPVYPYALYIDAVKFQRTDNVIGIWLCSLVTGLRQLCVAMRKSEMCACGCRGWCTMYCIMTFLNWSFVHMARGLAPSARHDGSPWKESESARDIVSGASLGWRGVVLFIKSDMMEHVTSFGFPSWATDKHPCPLCHCTTADWGNIKGLSPISLPWRPKLFAEYEQACAACEIVVDINCARLFRMVRGCLKYDKRIGALAIRGRALMRDIPELRLKKGDRLQPGHDIWDVGQIDTMNPKSACRLLFWRRSAETHVRHRNPVFSEETGIVPERVLVIDWLHALSLGVYKYFISHLWHTLFEHDVYEIGRCTDHEHIVLSLGRLRVDLFNWYAAELAQGRAHSRVQSLTPEMVGTASSHKLGTWGAETNGLLLFSQHLLRVHQHQLPNPDLIRNLVRGCDSLVGIHTIIKTHTGGRCPLGVAQDFTDHTKEHLHAMRELQIEVRAKHHALSHMGAKLLEYGTPALWACWTDEGENKMLAQLALRAHRLVWSRRLISDHRLAWGVRQVKRRKR
jgi:hypothetical protein